MWDILQVKNYIQIFKCNKSPIFRDFVKKYKLKK